MEEVIEAVDSPSSTSLSPYEESFAHSSASIAGIAVVVSAVGEAGGGRVTPANKVVLGSDIVSFWARNG